MFDVSDFEKFKYELGGGAKLDLIAANFILPNQDKLKALMPEGGYPSAKREESRLPYNSTTTSIVVPEFEPMVKLLKEHSNEFAPHELDDLLFLTKMAMCKDSVKKRAPLFAHEGATDVIAQMYFRNAEYNKDRAKVISDLEVELGKRATAEKVSDQLAETKRKLEQKKGVKNDPNDAPGTKKTFSNTDKRGLDYIMARKRAAMRKGDTSL